MAAGRRAQRRSGPVHENRPGGREPTRAGLLNDVLGGLRIDWQRQAMPPAPLPPGRGPGSVPLVERLRIKSPDGGAADRAAADHGYTDLGEMDSEFWQRLKAGPRRAGAAHLCKPAEQGQPMSLAELAAAPWASTTWKHLRCGWPWRMSRGLQPGEQHRHRRRQPALALYRAARGAWTARNWRRGVGTV